jgi:hypothetical protein
MTIPELCQRYDLTGTEAEKVAAVLGDVLRWHPWPDEPPERLGYYDLTVAVGSTSYTARGFWDARARVWLEDDGTESTRNITGWRRPLPAMRKEGKPDD